MRRRVLLLVLGVVGAALPLGVTAAARLPSQRLPSQLIPIDFACAPGGPVVRHQPLQREFQYALAPGQTLSDLLAVINLSKTKAVDLHLSVADAVTPARGGGITFDETGRQRGVGRWLQLGVSTLSVAAAQYVLLPLRVQVPATARPGEYAGAISATATHGVLVRQGHQQTLFHVSVRCDVLLRVLGPARAGLAIASAGLVAPYRQAVLAVRLQNTGSVIDYPLASVLTLVGRQRTYRLPARLNALVGGARTTVAWALAPAVPPGVYRGRIQIVYLARLRYGAAAQELRATWQGRVMVPGA